MDKREFFNILGAMIVLSAVSGLGFVLNQEWSLLPSAFFFSVVIILVSVFSKKAVAFTLDADVEHEIWKVYRYGLKAHHHFKKEAPAGIIVPLVLGLLSLGFFKFSAILTYETKALKVRAAKRFGYYSYTEMTDWHNALVGAGGILGIIILCAFAYFIPADLEYLARLASFYAFFNMLPISKLDGTQIFFGSRILWAALAVITSIFAGYAVLLP